MTIPLNHSFASLVMDMIKTNVTIQPLNLKHINIGYRDKEGKNSLYYSIKTKNSTNTKLLITSGIPLMVTSKTHALFHAIFHNDFDTVKFLIDKGIDIDIRDSEYKTPLMCAVYYNRVEICKYLLNEGADLFKMDLKHDMPINFATSIETKQIQDILHWRMIYEESKISN